MLMPIGSFAGVTGLSVRSLRRYDELGLLRPARVDPATGYRWYAPEQVRVALKIRTLRSLDLPLGEVRRVLEGDDERAILSAHLERIEGRVAGDTAIAEELRRLTGAAERPAGGDVLYRIEIKEIPAQELAVIAAQVPAVELRPWLRAAFEELFAHAGEQGIGPPFAIHPPPDDAGTVAAEAALPVARGVEPHGRIEVRHEPGFRALVALHRGPYDTLSRVRGALSTAIGEQGIEPVGSPREVYLGDPAEHELTEVVWPIDVTAEWRPHERLFTEPLPAG